MEEFQALIAECDRILEERGVENPAVTRAFIMDKLTQNDPYEAIEIAKSANLDVLRTAMEQEPAVAFMGGDHSVGEQMLEDAKRRAGMIDTTPVAGGGGVYAGRDPR